MDLVIDTNVIIYAEKSLGPYQFYKVKEYENIYLTSITVSELLVGVMRSKNEINRLKRADFVESLLDSIPIYGFTTEVAMVHARLFAALQEKGEMIGAHDLMTAAIAISNDCGVMTNNYREFERVDGLEVVRFEYSESAFE